MGRLQWKCKGADIQWLGKGAMRFGNWVAGGALGSAIPLTTDRNVYADGQLDLFSMFGESGSNLGSGYSAKCGRFRHMVNCTTAAHETYGLIGQLVVKGTTLTHLHAGLMGTLEGHTSGVVANSAYTYGVAAVIARVGGGGTITATKVVSGFSAILNGAAMYSGACAAFAACATSTDDWSYGLALVDCTQAFSFNGACVTAHAVGSIDNSHEILIDINGSPHALAVYAVG